MSRDIILKNGTIITVSGHEKKDVLVKNGKIIAIGDNLSETSCEEINCTGLTILPGVIDSQVHLREPGNEHKEDLETGGKAAILGGVTSVFEMPNTNPSTTTLEAFQDKLKRASGRMFTDHAFYVGASGDNIQELPFLEKQLGCAGVKIFMGSSTGSLLVSDDKILEQILAHGQRRIAIHAEDEDRLIERKEIAEKEAHPRAHPLWRDLESALKATKRIVALSQKTRRKIHVLHISTKDEIEFLRTVKGGLITAEVLANHLTLDAEAYETLGTYAQMNPPIRDKSHQEVLWQAVQDGTIDILATDHAPHTREEKEKPYPNSPSGMPGVQTLVPLMLDHVHNGQLTLLRMVDLLCHAPARVFGLRHKGFIRNGYDADFTIVDTNKKFIIDNKDIASKCGWTPFHGKEVTGKVMMTIIRGRIVMNDGQIIGEADGKPLEFDNY